MDELFKMDDDFENNLEKLNELENILKKFHFIMSLFFNNFRILDKNKNKITPNNFMELFYIEKITKEKLVLYEVYKYLNETLPLKLSEFVRDIPIKLNDIFKDKRDYYSDSDNAHELEYNISSPLEVTKHAELIETIKNEIEATFKKYCNDMIKSFNDNIDDTYLKLENYINNLFKYEIDKTNANELKPIIKNLLNDAKLKKYHEYKDNKYFEYNFDESDINPAKPYTDKSLTLMTLRTKYVDKYRSSSNIVINYNRTNIIYNLMNVINYKIILDNLYNKKETLIIDSNQSIWLYYKTQKILLIIWALLSELLLYFQEIIYIFKYKYTKSDKINIDYYDNSQTKKFISLNDNELNTFIKIFIKDRIIIIIKLFAMRSYVSNEINEINDINNINFFNYLKYY